MTDLYWRISNYDYFFRSVIIWQECIQEKKANQDQKNPLKKADDIINGHARRVGVEIGAHNKLPNYSVHGDKTNMYLWVNEDGKGSSSEWITGRVAFQLWNNLQFRYKNDKKGFVGLLKKHHSMNEKRT